MRFLKAMRFSICVALGVAAVYGGAAERPLRGPFPLLVTPWMADATLDVPTLVKEAEFVNRCGAGGVIWPSAAEVLGNLSMDEYRRGLDALAARAARPDFKSRLTAVCPGRSSAEALTRARLVNELQKKHNVEMALLARPPDNATNETAIVAHYRALGEVAECPVIIQTYNGKSPQQSVASIVALAKEFPRVYGWVKEESPGGLVNGRMAELVAAKPAIKTVFSGWGAKGWLYQGRRIGTEGVVTQRAPYADLLVYIWKRIENGDADHTLTDAYSKLLLMYNIGDTFGKGSDDMRGPHLYVLQRRGIFTNRLTRVKAKGAKNGKDGKKWEMKDVPLSDLEKAEIDARLEALKPYLYKGEIAPRD